MPDDFFAIFSQRPRESGACDVSHAAKACGDSNAATGRLRLAFAITRKRPRSASRLPRRNPELAFQHSDPRLQRLVLLACEPRHVLDRLELLALDQIEVAQEFLGLIAPERVDLALDALGGACSVV